MIRRYGALIFILLSSKAFAQQTKELPAGYYSVIAAYAESKEDYASRYAKELQASGMQAGYGYNAGKQMFFVYAKSHTTLKDALTTMYSLRKDQRFAGAWVRVVPGVIGKEAEPERPVTEEVAVVASASTKNQQEIKNTEKTSEVPSVTTSEVIETPEEKVLQPFPITLGNTEIFLSLFNASNNRIVDGEIQVIDAERGRLLKTVKGNEYMTLPDPKNQSGKITLSCDVFGYRKVQYEINYRNPDSDTIQSYVDKMGLSFVVTFDLVRYHTGDIHPLSHVQFYNDAAIMMADSRYELSQLLQMMSENPSMKIKLHGHTNGNYHGKIITVGPEKNYFAIGENVKTSVGSSKKLSYERAAAIKGYLVANKISADRIEVKGWGGKKPLFDKNSANAKKNLRVELEIVAN